jgi:hypothetical protein
MAYRGDLDLSGTGLEYRMPGHVLRDAIAILKQRHPETRVILSVGGAAYKGWDQLNLPAIIAFIHDFELDGMDIDFEPAHPACRSVVIGHISCATDEMWASIIGQARAALPRPSLLTASVWSVGAYGEGRFQVSRPQSDYTGILLPFLHSTHAKDLDLLSINAYDAGPQFDPLESFRAYRSVWPGLLALGVEVRRNGGEGPFHSMVQAEALAHTIARDPFGGMMLYPLLAKPEDTSLTSPDGYALAKALCRGMNLAACYTPH